MSPDRESWVLNGKKLTLTFDIPLFSCSGGSTMFMITDTDDEALIWRIFSWDDSIWRNFLAEICRRLCLTNFSFRGTPQFDDFCLSEKEALIWRFFLVEWISSRILIIAKFNVENIKYFSKIIFCLLLSLLAAGWAYRMSESTQFTPSSGKFRTPKVKHFLIHTSCFTKTTEKIRQADQKPLTFSSLSKSCYCALSAP